MNIWVPKAKILEPRRAIFRTISLVGRWRLEAVRPDGRRRFLAEFPNLITNAGLNYMGTNNDWLAACQVGTGNTTPNVADTGLASYLAGTATVSAASTSAESTPPYFGRLLKTFRFNTGVAAGNLAEIGIATSTSGGTMFSRALILDGSGNPTTITVLGDEILDATYDLRGIVPPSDVLDTVTIGGIDYDLTIRAANASTAGNWAPQGDIGGPNNTTAYSGTIGAITTTPGGSNASADSTTLASYSNNSLLREATATWGLSSGNFGGAGIRAINVQCGNFNRLGAFQVAFENNDSPSIGIPKTSSEILSLVLRHVWTRGTP